MFLQRTTQPRLLTVVVGVLLLAVFLAIAVTAQSDRKRHGGRFLSVFLAFLLWGRVPSNIPWGQYHKQAEQAEQEQAEQAEPRQRKPHAIPTTLKFRTKNTSTKSTSEKNTSKNIDETEAPSVLAPTCFELAN
ncbi:hypothetical protein DFJ73DRAFT_770035 [Zopfochytrium polystomum]|nr:hypothetical protein DFJ73DRAFT_770035 [Zopfochytrium polystomum]